jgi:ATP-binding cassette subfamily B protein/subfamily B ATP-binding cassette protein MsbA
MIYRRVLKYYRGFLGRSLIALAFSFAAIGLNLLKPWPFKIIVDQILPGRLKVFQFAFPPPLGSAIKTPVLDSAQAIGLLCLAMVIIQLLWSLLSFASNYMFVKIGLESLFRLRTELYAHLQRLSLKFHDTRRSTDSSFRVAYDSQSIQTIYNKGFTNIIGSGVTLIGTFAVMLRLDWQLTLLSVAIVPLLIGTIYFFAKRIRTQSTTIQEQESALLTQTQEGLSSIRMVHAFGREEFEVSQFHEQAYGSLQANLRLTMATMPPTGRNHFFAYFTVITSLSMGFAPILWGLLIDAVAHRDAAHAVHPTGLHLGAFTVYFLLLFVCSLVALVSIGRLDEKKSAPIDHLFREISLALGLKRLAKMIQRSHGINVDYAFKEIPPE